MREDEHLMARLIGGEQEAFEILVNRWYDRAVAYACALVGNRQGAEEIAMDCFAALYFKRALFDTTLSFEAYLKALIRYRSIDFLRRKRAPALALEEAFQIKGDDSPEEELIQKYFVTSLFGAVQRLPDRSKALIIAYAIEGLNYKALARRFGMTVPQVKITLHRIRKTLKHVKEEWK